VSLLIVELQSQNGWFWNWAFLEPRNDRTVDMGTTAPTKSWCVCVCVDAVALSRDSRCIRGDCDPDGHRRIRLATHTSVS
jgi:hypothetical protein